MDKKSHHLHRLPQVDSDFVQQICDRFAQLDRNGRIVLFGSRAKNTHKYFSDYDLLFLSDSFSSHTESERHFLILQKVRIPKSEWTIEPHCYTNQEWESRSGSLFYNEVMSAGLDLKSFL
jgi:hypothetical protein